MNICRRMYLCTYVVRRASDHGQTLKFCSLPLLTNQININGGGMCTRYPHNSASYLLVVSSTVPFFLRRESEQIILCISSTIDEIKPDTSKRCE